MDATPPDIPYREISEAFGPQAAQLLIILALLAWLVRPLIAGYRDRQHNTDPGASLSSQMAAIEKRLDRIEARLDRVVGAPRKPEE